MTNMWQPLGAIAPQQLTEARLELHWAIQLLAAPSIALVQPQPDYSHMSLAWSPEVQALISQEIPASTALRIVLDPVRLEVAIASSANLQELLVLPFSLIGQTMDAGLSWLKEQLQPLAVDISKIVWIDYPQDDFPYDYAIAKGAVFSNQNEQQRQELAHYYANSSALLEEITLALPTASALHIWPHHFDLASLITISPGEDAESSKTIGVGFSPGDRSYNQPYWYVSPWPYPQTANLPELEGGGSWHTQGWVGAVLTGEHLITSSADHQQEQLRSFFTSALKACEILLLFNS